MTRLLFIAVFLQFIGLNESQAQSWSNGSINGEGEVVRQEINLAAFDGIGLGFHAAVILTQGNTQKVVIEAQQNIIDNIKKEVRGGSWDIGFMKSVKSAKDITIYITLPKVKDLALSGSGSIRSTNKFSNLGDVDIAVSGSGDVHFEYDGGDTDLALSGSGDVHLSGTASSLEVAVSGSGDVSASELKAGSCDVAISGSGDVTVYVNGDLDAAIMGSGDVRYKGDAKVSASVMGSGSVTKL